MSAINYNESVIPCTFGGERSNDTSVSTSDDRALEVEMQQGFEQTRDLFAMIGDRGSLSAVRHGAGALVLHRYSRKVTVTLGGEGRGAS